MEYLGRSILVVGALLILVAFLIHFCSWIALLGKLPGDIRFERAGFRFYLPITTCIILSLAFSIVMYLVSRMR